MSARPFLLPNHAPPIPSIAASSHRTAFAVGAAAGEQTNRQRRLGTGQAQETLGVVDEIKALDPEFYADHKLAAYRGAANFLLNRISEAQADFAAAEITRLAEERD